MTSDPSARLLQAGFDVEALKRDLEQAREAVLTAARSASVTPPLGSLALAAAIRGSFLPSDLGFASDADPSPTSELGSLLAHSEVVTIGSRQAWQLKPEARRTILMQARKDGRLRPAVQERIASAQSLDAEGRLLCNALNGQIFQPERMPLDELTCLVTVSEWLADTDLMRLPPQAELRRLVQQRELLEPFRQLVGRTVEAGSDSSNDRMVGRVEETESLRAYVGIVPPDQLRHYLKRGMSSIWSTVSFSDAGHEPFLIQGIGGMGKSTLMAKFILDHALIEGVRLPFVYLDFDRAALAPRQPLQLLIDVALQLSVWIPEVEQELRELREVLRSSIDGQAASAELQNRELSTRSKLRSFCGKLRTIVEGFNSGRAPVLFLFDTFEVVQYDEEAVKGVTALISQLSGRDSKDPWTNLRIVVAGRADMPEITTSRTPMVLGRLTRADTQELIKRRNTLDEVGLTPKQIGVLAKPLRNSPLDVAIVMNWLKSRKPQERATLIEDIVVELAQETRAGEERESGPLATRRVTGILIGRMIKHINDSEVRQLANPGLVVRTVTPKVIRYVMAPASGLVKSANDLPKGAEDELFRRLALERWLVVRSGDAVHHRPEVRAAMLDLMRRENKENRSNRDSFAKTNERAIAYFRQDADDNPDARAELIYHLLLSGPPSLEEVEELWRADLGPRLAKSIEEVEGIAQAYLKAKLGRSVSQQALRALPPSLRLSVLLSHGKRMLQRAAPEGLLELLKTSRTLEENTMLLGLKLEALYRGGRWGDILLLVTDAISSSRSNDLFRRMVASLRRGEFEQVQALDDKAGSPLRFVLRWATRDPRADRLWVFPNLDLSTCGAGLGDALKREEAYWDLATFSVCAGARLPSDPSLGATMLENVGDLCRSPDRLPAAANEGGALRVLAFFEDHVRHSILRRVEFSNHFSTVCGSELKEFTRIVEMPYVASDATEGAVKAQRLHAKAVERGQRLLARLQEQPSDVVIADSSITQEFASIVGALVETGSSPVVRSVTRMLALKHPDWLEPMGHALSRAFHGEVPSKVGWWSSIDRYFGSEGRRRRRSGKRLSDGLEILSLADEAGSLPEAVSAYAGLLGDQQSADAQGFLELARAFREWQSMLEADRDPAWVKIEIGMEFEMIPAGEFQMGSGPSARKVHISQPFYLGKYPVTQAQWAAVMGNNPSEFKGDPNRPVEKVSWEEVQQFIRDLNAQEGSESYRLPTEAEWEYACRAGSTTAYCFGDDEGRLGEYAWYKKNAGGQIHPVGKLKPNAWGLYDMHGNVWEWVQDWYTQEEVDRVNRGGSWVWDAKFCGSTIRGHVTPGHHAYDLGFRLLRTAPAAVQ